MSQFNFFKEIQEIKQKNKLLFENVSLGIENDEEAAIKSNKLWNDFIYSFHYPHEKIPTEFGTKNIMSEEIQMLASD